MSAVPALSEVPSVQSEIDRKAFQTLEKLARQLENGEINQAMFNVGVRTIWDCTAGIASTMVMDTVSEVKEIWITDDMRDMRVLYHPLKGAVALERKLGEVALTLSQVPGGMIRKWDFSGELNGSRKALKSQDATEAALISRGYVKV